MHQTNFIAELEKPTEIFSNFIPSFQTQSSLEIPQYIDEFWTAQQRQAHSLHEISYRACFKPQLPHFFITHLTKENDVVYDPFFRKRHNTH